MIRAGHGCCHVPQGALGTWRWARVWDCMSITLIAGWLALVGCVHLLDSHQHVKACAIHGTGSVPQHAHQLLRLCSCADTAGRTGCAYCVRQAAFGMIPCHLLGSLRSARPHCLARLSDCTVTDIVLLARAGEMSTAVPSAGVLLLTRAGISARGSEGRCTACRLHGCTLVWVQWWSEGRKLGSGGGSPAAVADDAYCLLPVPQDSNAGMLRLFAPGPALRPSCTRVKQGNILLICIIVSFSCSEGYRYGTQKGRATDDF